MKVLCLIIISIIFLFFASSNFAETVKFSSIPSIKTECEKKLSEKYFRNPLKFLEEEIENENPEYHWRHTDDFIAIALYYLGFSKDIFKSVSYVNNHGHNLLPAPDFFPLLKRESPKDLKKAVYWIEEAYKSAYGVADVIECVAYMKNSFLFEKIGTSAEVEKYFEKLKRTEKIFAAKLEKDSKFRELAYNINNPNAKKYLISYDMAYYSYIYYKGYHGVEKDLDKARKYARMTHISYWKNFYTGYAAPMDKDFAIFLLESINNSLSNRIIGEIKNGYYDKKQEQ